MLILSIAQRGLIWTEKKCVIYSAYGNLEYLDNEWVNIRDAVV